MQFGRNRALREQLYRAYGTRASDQAEGDAVKFDNGAIIRELIALRQEEAALLHEVGTVALKPAPGPSNPLLPPAVLTP
jgi:Zn-dependent oligopeptidase